MADRLIRRRKAARNEPATGGPRARCLTHPVQAVGARGGEARAGPLAPDRTVARRVGDDAAALGRAPQRRRRPGEHRDRAGLRTLRAETGTPSLRPSPAASFSQIRALVREGLAAGTVTTAQAEFVEALVEQLSEGTHDEWTEPWEDAQLHKVVRADDRAPKHTRDVVVRGRDRRADRAPRDREAPRQRARDDSVQHGPRNDVATIAAFVRVRRDRLRVEVSDGSSAGVRPRTPSAAGGYGIALVAELASRWGTGRERGVNVTWFELDLPVPGS